MFDLESQLPQNPLLPGKLRHTMRVVRIIAPRPTRFLRFARLYHWAVAVVNKEFFRCEQPRVVIEGSCTLNGRELSRCASRPLEPSDGFSLVLRVPAGQDVAVHPAFRGLN